MPLKIPRPAEVTGGLRMQIGTIPDQPSAQSEMAAYHVKIEIDEDGRYVAECIELQGVVTDGATEDEVIENIHEAVEAMLEAKGQTKEFYLIIDSFV